MFGLWVQCVGVQDRGFGFSLHLLGMSGFGPRVYLDLKSR